MKPLLPSPGLSLLDDETTVLETRRRALETEMFYRLPDLAPDCDDEGSWSPPFPRDIWIGSGEYYVPVKGLRVAIVRGYSMLDVTTNSSPILDHLCDCKSPPDERMSIYETALQLVEQIDAVSIMAYAVDLRPSG